MSPPLRQQNKTDDVLNQKLARLIMYFFFSKNACFVYIYTFAISYIIIYKNLRVVTVDGLRNAQ